MRTVSEIMTRGVQVIDRESSIREAERIFITEKISGAPITDENGDLVGFVSKTDIVHFDSSGEDPVYTRLHEIATPNIVTIDVSAPINEAAQKMLREQVHHLVVTDGEAMVGILSAFDFVRIAADLLFDDEEEGFAESLC